MDLDLSIRWVRDGKIYDTKTAELVAIIKKTSRYRWEYDDERTALFLTKKGQWFIAGEGGAFSRWGREPDGGGDPKPGEGLELLTEDEARELLEQIRGDIVEFYFDVEEG
ncbi:hypothetical protein [Pelagibacterium sp. H642]|uniref:hypothetical protein n=1 Tax=Pelagibacterium sp. H642 TaxID=1881069 RepID=UPI0028158233|nr:hypothetical protein [Pelagibacterium sp. H642]WMT89360.1 hypothetical protein NO934_11140 [Pelagibacterium sp. H642]